MYFLILAFSYFTLSLVICLILIPAIIKIANRYTIYEKIDSRKIHSKKISFLGGIAIFISFYISTRVAFNVEQPVNINYLFASIFLMFITGIGDDFFVFSSFKKIIFQFLSALLISYLSLYQLSSTLVTILKIENLILLNLITYGSSIFIILAISNAFNLIDGHDGLCSSLALLTSFFYGVIFLNSNEYFMSSLAFSLAGSITGFLFYNKPNAKIFMGDGGSLFIGILISVFTLYFIENNKQSFSFYSLNYRINLALSLICLPVFDMIRVCLYRIYHKKNPFVADRGHIHHLFVDLGFSKNKTLFSILLIQLFLILFFFILIESNPIILFFLSLFFYSFIVIIFTEFKNIRNTILKKNYFSKSENIKKIEN